MSTERPWRAAVWQPVPGERPTGVRRRSFPTAWAAQSWLRKQNQPGLVRRLWHESQLPPAELPAEVSA